MCSALYNLRMSRRSKIKIIKNHMDKDAVEMFNQMVGASDTVNIPICQPKYINIENGLQNAFKILTMMNEGCIKLFPHLSDTYTEIANFVETASADLKTIFNVKREQYASDEEFNEAFSKSYIAMKEHKLINLFIGICNELICYKKYIELLEILDEKFIINMPGTDFAPLVGITSFNIKEFVTYLRAEIIDSTDVKHKEISRRMIKLIMLVLHKLYVISYKIYKEVTSADIDVNEFVKVIMSNIQEVKKKIPRCEKAFKKIEQSVHLLKEKFGDYYKDFIVTKNQTIIMENFVLDVAKQTNTDIETTRQFKEIIKYYRKVAAQQPGGNNPKLSALLSKMESSIGQLEKHHNIQTAENAEQEENDTDETADDDSEYSEEGAAAPEEDSEEMKIRRANMGRTVEDLAAEIDQ